MDGNDGCRQWTAMMDANCDGWQWKRWQQQQQWMLMAMEKAMEKATTTAAMDGNGKDGNNDGQWWQRQWQQWMAKTKTMDGDDDGLQRWMEKLTIDGDNGWRVTTTMDGSDDYSNDNGQSQCWTETMDDNDGWWQWTATTMMDSNKGWWHQQWWM